VIQVMGDSMAPTLSDGDDILVNLSDGAAGLRDGIYVLRLDGALNVKRLIVDRARGRGSVKSDNPAYTSWPTLDLSRLDVIGRVIWAGRRLG
jgi:phage repressor protein C with HTH and peptisase S24 domain